jgi:hypothetical protein
MYGGPPACGRLANSVTRSESCRTLGIPTRSVASHCCTSEPIPCGASLTRLENAVLPSRCAELPGLLHLSAVIELVTQVIADQVGVQLAAALHWCGAVYFHAQRERDRRRAGIDQPQPAGRTGAVAERGWLGAE